MAAVIQSSFGPILLACQKQLIAQIPFLTLSPTACAIVADDTAPEILADQDVLLRPGSFVSSKPDFDGAGRSCTRLVRYLTIYPRTRVSLDEANRAEVWLTDPGLGQFQWEEACTSALNGFFPSDLSQNLITDCELRISDGTDPHKTALDVAWGKSAVTFEVEYLFSLNNQPWNPPLITTLTLPQMTPGNAYSAMVLAIGGTTPYVFSYVGTIPPGLTLSSIGVISGTPTTGGEYVFTVVCTDANGQRAAQLYHELFPMSFVTASPLPAATSGTPYSEQLAVSGNIGAVTYAVTSGSFPSGISLSGGGLLSGTP